MPDPAPGLDRAGAVGREDEAIAKPGAALIGGLGMSTEPKRNRPPRSGIDSGPIDPVEPTFERHDWRRPELAQQGDLLFDPCGPSAEILAKRFVFDIIPANPDSEPQTLSREQ